MMVPTRSSTFSKSCQELVSTCLFLQVDQGTLQLEPMSPFDRLAQVAGKPAYDVTQLPDLLQQGKAALDRSDSSSALKAFGVVVQIDPEHPEGWSGLGNAYSEAGESDRAIEAFSKAVEFDAGNGENFLQLGREQLAANQNEQAQANLMQGLLLSRDESDTDDWYNLALCLYHQHKQAQAVPFCRRVLERDITSDPDAQQL